MSQLLTHCIIWLFSYKPNILSKRTLWEAVSKALLKFKKITSTGFPISYRWVTLWWHGYRSKYKSIDDICFPVRLYFTHIFFNFNVAVFHIFPSGPHQCLELSFYIRFWVTWASSLAVSQLCFHYLFSWQSLFCKFANNSVQLLFPQSVILLPYPFCSARWITLDANILLSTVRLVKMTC